MKKTILFICIIAITFTFQTAKAQFDFVGGGLLVANNAKYELDGIDYNNNSFGINLRMSYNYSKKFKIVPSINIFLPKEETFTTRGSSKVSLYAFNLDGHFILNPKTRAKYKVYLLAGAHVGGWHIKDDRTTSFAPITTLDVDEFKFVFGANVGAGMEFPLANQLYFFAEVKYTIAKAHQLVFNPGLKYELF